MKRVVFIVQHTEHEHAGLIGRALAASGSPIEFVRLDLGESLPKLGEVSGILSLGGPMSVNDEDEHPWIEAECDFLKEAILGGTSVVGVCLGAQLIAKALGGRVTRNPMPEIGWYPVNLNGLGKKDSLLSAGGHAPTVYHWHGETFELPEHAELLASSAACPHQAFRITKNRMRVYGFQFHPEIDPALVSEWLDHEDCLAEIKRARVLGERFVQTPDEQKKAQAGSASETFSKRIADFLTAKAPKSAPRRRPKRSAK